MKKFIFILSAALLMAAGSFAQRITMNAGVDSLSGAETKYYPATIQADLYYGSFQAFVDHSVGTTDSTHVWIQGSVDGIHWEEIGSTTVNARTLASNPASTTFELVCFYTTDDSHIWSISTPLLLPYYRYAVQHYVAASSIFFKGYLFKKK